MPRRADGSMERKYGRRHHWSMVEREDGGLRGGVVVLEHARGGADVIVVAEWRGTNDELRNRYVF